MSSSTTAVAASSLKLVARRSQNRGHADHGWLKSFHTFSFANYQENQFNQFGALRVINEDRVAPGEGFGQHSHANFEIFSYVVEGELEHKDSLGNLEILTRGDVQMTSTGTGISHSEYNRNPLLPVHFLQIWALPGSQGLKPNYYNRHFTDEDKRNKLVQIVGPVGSAGVIDERNTNGPAPVHAKISTFASLLSPKSSLSHTLSGSTTKAYLHLIMKSGYRRPSVSAAEKYETGGARLRINGGLVLEEGDGAFISALGNKTSDGEREVKIESIGEVEGEFLLFEMDQ